ncbi:MAG TPA: hypothetical protein VG095_01040 [Chthoniobacterales bacterium]|nr:hypothetical protein [Chthoniobacterales bacterium]
MRRVSLNAPPRSHERGSIIVLLLVVLAVLGGGYWFLKSYRDMREKEAWEFANRAADRIVLKRDSRFLDFNLTQRAQMNYPPSWRARMMHWVADVGTPSPQFQMKGDVTFKNYFFEPSGRFVAQFNYPTGPAYLELHISHPGALWVIDDLNWTWPPQPPPPAPPAPAPGVQPIPATPAPGAPPIAPTATPGR